MTALHPNSRLMFRLDSTDKAVVGRAVRKHVRARAASSDAGQSSGPLFTLTEVIAAVIVGARALDCSRADLRDGELLWIRDVVLESVANSVVR